MNDEQFEAVHELSGLYALDALEELDRSRFERHLATCTDCQHEVAEFRETMAHVASLDFEAANGGELPPALRTSVLSQINSIPQSNGTVSNGTAAATTSPFTRAPATAGRRRANRSGATRWYAAIAAAAAVVAVLIGFVALRADDPADDYALLAELRAHGATSVPMTGTTSASVELVREADGDRAIVVATNLAQVSPDSGYQAWIINGSTVLPASVFVPHEDGRAIVVLDDLPDNVESIAVTVEPRSGSDTPTSEVVFSAKTV